jgi:hypothetical protein
MGTRYQGPFTYKANTWVTPFVWARDAGVWKKAAVWTNSAGVWKETFKGIAGTAATLSHSGILAVGASGEPFTTVLVDCQPNGGGGHSYAWSRVSGFALTILSPISFQTKFSGTIPPGSQSGIYKCTVTDGDGTIYDSTTVLISTESTS